MTRCEQQRAEIPKKNLKTIENPHKDIQKSEDTEAMDDSPSAPRDRSPPWGSMVQAWHAKMLITDGAVTAWREAPGSMSTSSWAAVGRCSTDLGGWMAEDGG